MEIIPAILEKDINEVLRLIKLLDGHCSHIQIDLIDGIYIENQTISNLAPLSELELTSNLELDLFVQKPTDYLLALNPSVSRVCTHVEQPDDLESFIFMAKDRGLETGLSLEPQTSVSEIEPYLEKIDFVQFMTIHPGQQGSPFVPEVLPKIKEFTHLYPTVTCQADGSIGMENIKKIAEAGVTRFAVGSQIVKKEDPQAELGKLQEYISGLDI